MLTILRALVLAAAAALLSSCAPQPAERAPERAQPARKEAPTGFPGAYYEKLKAERQPVYRVDPAHSLVVIEVRRAGALAKLGHDHVVTARNIAGFVAPAAGRADLYVVLDELIVDEPAVRKTAGMDTQPSESDIAGTRSNMLEKVLETHTYPAALIRVSEKGIGAFTVTFSLHGASLTLVLPGTVEMDGKQIVATGRLAFNQTDFGITPYSILGGAIQVRDRVELSYTVRAWREAAP